jgi:3-oxo-5-alpha-steroid 4-dehydrogenase 1
MNYNAFQNLIYLWMVLGVAVFLLLLKITAPYGRHTSSRWGPQINNRLGWVIMEVPAIILLMCFMVINISNQNAITWALAGLFIFHYINRTFVYPFRIHTKGKKMPIVIVGSGFLFNLVNGFFLGFYFGHFADYVSNDFFKLHFGIGFLLFVYGVILNWKYDNKLIHLRQSNNTNYMKPEGGLFNYVSCPNLLGEIIEWIGYAIICWNLPAVSFLVWTIANLIPRALSHHKWYKQRFENYPAQRKALLPFIL